MAYDYNKIKDQYEQLNDEQKQQFANMKGWNVQQFLDDYKKEQASNNPQQTSNESNFNNQNGTTWQNSTQNQTTNSWSEQAQNLNNWYETKTYWKTEFDKNEQLDKSMFNEAPWKVTVKEWTAKDTGLPDYWLSSDARLNEMKKNLDQYFKDSPRMFNDRDTFNKVFEYNSRESEAQRQLLDSYWKRKEDMDKASQYTSWESIYNWMKNWQITTDQLNLLKEMSPEAYREWQQKQEEEIKLRIINDIVPPLLEDISTQMINTMNNLGIQPQDALDIEGIYNSTMESTWAYQTLADANDTVKQIEYRNNKKVAIANRYASSTWGTVSDALAAARMQKALAPCNEAITWLQYQYQDYANLYNQKLATATQAASVRQAQAQENQRVRQQRLTALWFAQTTMSYRTPEQQAQLRLQEKELWNELDLLYQSKLQDLNRYNTYATAKLNNQLQQELTDLSVEDETQLKANLNNALSDYYDNYGDIIQRSQSQAVEDIIDYAKKKGISVAQALTENFIKPLQNKAEYKQKVATDYWMLSKQSIATINWRSVIMTTNPNWSISYKYIDDASWIISSYTIWDTSYVVLSNGDTMTAEEYNTKYGNKKWELKNYNVVDERAFTNSPMDTWYSWKTLYDFMSDSKNQAWKSWGQCAAFVNRYLESIGVGKIFGTEDAQTRASWCNSDTAKVWTIAVFDYNHYTDWKNYGHVAIVTKVYEDWSFDVLDSNYDTKNPWKITKRHINAGSASLKWFLDPSQPPSSETTSTSTENSVDRLTLTALRNWQIVNSKVPETIEQLVKAGFSEEEINEALNQNMEYYLPDDQRAEKNAILNSFRSNEIVKNFQSATEQFLWLSAAVNEANGAWDLASIYMFMRAQDPKSVVREGEFEMAAQTMGLWGQVETWFSKLASWQRLTPEQRQNFIDVTVKVLEAKKQAYKLVYDEAVNQMKAASIPSVYYPTDWASEIDWIISKLKGGSDTSWPDDVIYDIYSSAMNNSHWAATGNWYNNASYGEYETSFLEQMINSKL